VPTCQGVTTSVLSNDCRQWRLFAWGKETRAWRWPLQSLLQVFRLSSRQLHSLIHGHVRVLRQSNNGPVAGGLTQTQNPDISKHLSYLYTRTQSWIVCKGRYDDCVHTVLLTLHTQEDTMLGGAFLCFKIQSPCPLVHLRNVVFKLNVQKWSNDTDSGWPRYYEDNLLQCHSAQKESLSEIESGPSALTFRRLAAWTMANNFDVFLTVHLSIIIVINQLNSQILVL